MNVNKRLRLNIFGYVQALLFSAMLLIFINGEAGWGMIYIIAAGIAASTVVFAASRKHFTVECSSFSGLYRKGDTVKAELVFRAKGFCILPHITVNGDFMGKPFTARCDLIGRTCRVEISMAAEYCGLNRLRIEDVILRDSLGLIPTGRTLFRRAARRLCFRISWSIWDRRCCRARFRPTMTRKQRKARFREVSRGTNTAAMNPETRSTA